MKKIIAAAVTAAFVAPAFAADVTLSGSQEFNYQDNNGTTTAEIDGTIAVGASTQTANGLISAVTKLDDAGSADGGASLSIASGDMGKLSLGDVSGAVDAIDDINDWGYEGTTGVGGDDASLLWSLPSIAPNLTVYFSAGTDATEGGGQDGTNHTAVSFKYSAGPATIGFGQQETQGGAEERVANIKVSMAGLTAGYELHTAPQPTRVLTLILLLLVRLTEWATLRLRLKTTPQKPQLVVLQQISHLWVFITLWVVALLCSLSRKMMRKIRLQRLHTWVHRSSSNSLTA